MNKLKVAKVKTTKTKLTDVLENKQLDSLQEIIRRMKASSQTREFDPIIHRKLAQVSKR